MLRIKLTVPQPDLAKLLLRISIGGVFVYHGAQKLFGAFGGHGIKGFTGYLQSMGMPFPALNAYLAGGAEFFCGVAVMLGFMARWAAIPLIITMVVAIVLVTGAKGFEGYEYNLVLIAALATIFFQGSGKWRLKNDD